MKKRIFSVLLALCMTATLVMPVQALSIPGLEDKITDALDKWTESRQEEVTQAKREGYVQKIEAICRDQSVSVAEIAPLRTESTYINFIEGYIKKIASASSDTTGDLQMELLLKDMMGLAYVMKANGSVPAELETLLWELENTCARKTTATARLVERACSAMRSGFDIKRAEVVPGEGNSKIIGFDDVPKSHWAYPYIMTVVNAGGMEGTKDLVNGIGHFEPSAVVTMDQFLTVLIRLVAADQIVPARAGEHWAAPYYRTAKELGWLHFEGTHIGLSEELDELATKDDMKSYLGMLMRRDVMAHYLVAAAQENGESLPYVEELPFEDKEYIAYERAVSMCYAAGLLEGSNNRFRPSASMTRAELATICCRLMKYMDRKEPQLTSEPIYVHDNFYKYVSEDGYTIDAPGSKNDGKIRVIHARQFNREAMGMVRVGADEKGVYIEATAPVLPGAIGSDVGFAYHSILYRENDFFVSESLSFSLKQGETKKFYYTSNEREGDYVRAKEVVNITVSVSTRGTITHSVAYSAPGYIVERESTEPMGFNDYYDTAPIWSQWKG